MELKMASPVAILIMFLVFFSATRCRSLAKPQELLDRQIQELVEALSDQPSLWYNYDTEDYEPRIPAGHFSRNSRAQERKQRRFVFPGLQDLFQRAKLASGGNPWRVTEMMYTNGKTGRK
ncbi:uncharacterized protein [Branchiostoma lanceolatum]|uniref:Hypp8656 protein n=1 Tax=Branchiostoma lanceolatum TaxID=7740 RepID=A0A8K0EE73_BRALA|nr:Hypp8656 [Branchiostoma lanceolatum]